MGWEILPNTISSVTTAWDEKNWAWRNSLLELCQSLDLATLQKERVHNELRWSESKHFYFQEKSLRFQCMDLIFRPCKIHVFPNWITGAQTWISLLPLPTQLFLKTFEFYSLLGVCLITAEHRKGRFMKVEHSGSRVHVPWWQDREASQMKMAVQFPLIPFSKQQREPEDQNKENSVLYMVLF